MSETLAKCPYDFYFRNTELKFGKTLDGDIAYIERCLEAHEATRQRLTLELLRLRAAKILAASQASNRQESVNPKPKEDTK